MTADLPAKQRPFWRRNLVALLLLGVILVWLGGLFWFASIIPDEVADNDSRTDAIVVLTGGSLRVQNGIALLAEGKARKLFVSGVYRGTDVTAILHASRQSPDPVACCIELGHVADNTEGNALETAVWMRAENFHSLRLVTGSYHMPRSLLEFSRAMPDIRIVPNPVFPGSIRHAFWTNPKTASLIIGEYMKYLAALLRLEPGGAPS